MGHAKTEKLANGNLGVEITYGGLEAPFGGVDTSAPPAYIDGKCFAASDGFVVVDNKLCVANWQSVVFPTLWSGTMGVTLLKVGTFYSSPLGQLNYALGFAEAPDGSTLNGIVYTFYMTSWNYNTYGAPALIGNDTFSVRFLPPIFPPTVASITLPILSPLGPIALLGDKAYYYGTLALGVYLSGGLIATVSIAVGAPQTVAEVVAAFVTQFNTVFNGAPGFDAVFASASTDGLGIVITANADSSANGAAGNNYQVADASTNGSTSRGIPYYFPAAPVTFGPTNLQGGTDAYTTQPVFKSSNISTASVGGTLYMAGLGPMILKYAGPGLFKVSSLYAGVQILRKFAGSLIGLGNIPALNNVVQDTSMIFSWSAAEDLDEWSPEDGSGNITGAGFTQLADIGDSLTGLVVSNNTAFIIRSEGLSYATALGSGADPFQFSHIGLGDSGEGAQDSQLVCAYDQTGAYVGNTNIFQLSSTISPIGNKIKALFFSLLQSQAALTGSVACAVTIGGDTWPVILFMIGGSTFLYNTSNNTWQVFSYTGTPTGNEIFCDILAFDQGVANLTAYSPVLVFQEGRPTSLVAISLTEGLANVNSRSIAPFVTFPQEELLFGRDITVDALYIALWANVTADTTVTFYINGIIFSTLILQPATYNTLSGNPIEVQIYPQTTTTAGAFTVHSPQLQIQIQPFGNSDTAQIRFSKIQMYASFDPSQRPV